MVSTTFGSCGILMGREKKQYRRIFIDAKVVFSMHVLSRSFGELPHENDGLLRRFPFSTLPAPDEWHFQRGFGNGKESESLITTCITAFTLNVRRRYGEPIGQNGAMKEAALF